MEANKEAWIGAGRQSQPDETVRAVRARFYRKKLGRLIREWILPLAIEIVVLNLAIQYVFFLAVVPTGSMRPAIQEKNWLFVTRVYNTRKTVDRGDILVFNSDELQQTLIKRVVGLPGDQVAIEDGKLYVNGTLQNEPYVQYPSAFGGDWVVPEDQYLFMGDNRADSFDARYWRTPFIPASEIEGEARFVLWPPNQIGPLV